MGSVKTKRIHSISTQERVAAVWQHHLDTYDIAIIIRPDALTVKLWPKARHSSHKDLIAT